jgi:hypothetical protein
MWEKKSLVEVAPHSFPQCVASTLTNAGHTPMMYSDPDGSPRVVTGIFSGALNVTEIPDYTVNAELLQLRLIGRGFRPPKDTEPQIEEVIGSLTTAIAKACNTG